MPRPTYKRTVSTCALSLVFGAILLTYLMETREMAPPRKYVVNTQGDIVGVAKPEKKADVTDADTMKLKEQVEKKIESAKKAEVMKKEEEGLRAENLIVPSVPDEAPDAVAPHVETPKASDLVPKAELNVPKVEKVE